MQKKIIKNSKKYTFIKLHLLKYQIYKQQSGFLFKTNLEQLNIKIKQALKIIYLYHISNKKILFIGFPHNKKITKQLNHTFVPKNILTKRFFDTQIQQNFTIFPKKQSKNLNSKFFRQIKLVVLNNVTIKDENTIKEINKQNIPLIVFGDQTFRQKPNLNYTISCSLLQKKIKSFCFFLIFSILRKPIKLYYIL